MKISKEIKGIMTYVQELFNAPVYLVGGAVRDILLGLEPKDYDFCSGMSTDEVKEALKGKHRVYTIGERHGTIGFKVGDEMVEITTFRTEIYTKGSRQPEVKFVNDIVLDLSRRDFTINAMAINCIDFKLIDPFNGEEDLQNKTLKTVGKPKERFEEDSLRVLRGVRLASKYDLIIEAHTSVAIKKMSYKLLNISKERWMEEFDKILSLDGDRLEMGLLRLWNYNIFHYTIPELGIQLDFDQDSPYHHFVLHIHTTKVVIATPNVLNLRWSALLHDIGKPFTKVKNSKGYSNYIHHQKLGAEMIEKIALHLKWSNERRTYVKDMVKNHLDEDSILKPYDDISKLRIND